ALCRPMLLTTRITVTIARVMNCFFLVNHGALTGHVSASATNGGDIAFASETQTLTDSEARF
ncbi:hypothetical protein, partial [Salmonella enterica]|uniref:hypothetical protein n=1 Tax=Salmonella enterica TaxID=28901 RepID=UPI001CB72100